MRLVRRKRRAGGQNVIPAAAAPSTRSSQVVRTKKKPGRGRQIHIYLAKAPPRRRRTAQIRAKIAKKARAYAVCLAQIPSRRGLDDDSRKKQLLPLLCSNWGGTKRARKYNVNNWRDWANLDDGPAGLIAERVLAYDVADYVRFRAVCRPWRQSSTEPPRTHSGGLDRRFHPWRWTVLREELAEPDRRCFLNTSTGECIKVHIPELHDHELLALTPEGLLVLARKPPCTTTICLLNPLTRNLMQLPPLSTLVPSEYHDHMLPERDALTLKSGFKAWGSGIATDDSTVVLCFNYLNLLGMAKPGDHHWTLLKYNGARMTAAPIMFQGRFYCVTRSGVMRLQTETGPPRLEVAAKLNVPARLMSDFFHLVNNCGELMLVHSRLRRVNKSGRFYDTYHVNLDNGTLIPVKSLGGTGRALFLGHLCSVSVSIQVFPSASISADTIYLSFDMQERYLLHVAAYHLADGSVQPPSSFVPRPHTIADSLSLATTNE